MTIAHQRVLACLSGVGVCGLTAEELIAVSGPNRNTVPPRLTELAQADLMIPCGERLTSAGKLVALWMLASMATEEAAQTILMRRAGPVISTGAVGCRSSLAGLQEIRLRLDVVSSGPKALKNVGD